MALFANENAYDEIIKPLAEAYGVDVALIKATMAQESSFNEKAFRAEPQINDGSTGLMQILMRTAKALGYTGDAMGLYDPSVNIMLGAKLIAQNITQAEGNLDIAISAYNAGFSAERPHDAKRDNEGNLINQSYVNKVKTYYAYFKGAISSTEAETSNIIQGASDNITLIGIGAALLAGFLVYLTFK